MPMMRRFFLAFFFHQTIRPSIHPSIPAIDLKLIDNDDNNNNNV
jgi:hypothetical protein